jgi:hypothetical protein
MKNPTNPDSAAESRASSAHLDVTLLPPTQIMQPSLQTQSQIQNSLPNLPRSLTPNLGPGYSDGNYEVFDPLNW